MCELSKYQKWVLLCLARGFQCVDIGHERMFGLELDNYKTTVFTNALEALNREKLVIRQNNGTFKMSEEGLLAANELLSQKKDKDNVVQSQRETIQA